MKTETGQRTEAWLNGYEDASIVIDGRRPYDCINGRKRLVEINNPYNKYTQSYSHKEWENGFQAKMKERAERMETETFLPFTASA